MSAAAAVPTDGAAEAGAAKGGGKKKLIILAIPLVLVAVVAGLWFGGILPPLLGMGSKAAHDEHGAESPAEAKADPHAAKTDAHGAKPDPHAAKPAAEAHGGKPATPATPGKPAEGHGAKAESKPSVEGAPNFVEVPDIIANLNAGPRRTVYVKLRSRVELARPEDGPLVQAAMPRLLDLFQTYLREMRPEELRGSAGTYRLREELIARANIALAPARVQDLLFTEMLIQ